MPMLYSSIFGEHKYIVPDVVEPIVGYRAWRIENDVLCSTTYRHNIWLPGKTLKAKCSYDSTENNKRCTLQHSLHHPPHKGGLCGFYAYNEPEWNIIKLKVGGCYSLALGEVELWGKIIEHEVGYRGQYARVKRVIKMAQADGTNLFQQISERYNIYD